MFQIFRLFAFQFRLNPFLLLCGQKTSVLRPAWQDKVGDDSKQDGRNAFKNQQPPPAPDSKPVDVVQDVARQGRSHDTGYWQPQEKQRNRTRLFPLGKPIGQVQIDSRNVTRLGQTEQKSRPVQLVNVVHEASQCRNDTPADQNAADPDSCADLVQQ